MVANYNIWAILVAAVVNNVVGGTWYARSVFGRAWMKEVGLSEANMPAKMPMKPFITATVASIVLAVALAWLNAAAGSTTVLSGIGVGLVTGVGIIMAAEAPHYAFAGRSLKLYAIDMGHALVNVLLMSIIVAAWH